MKRTILSAIAPLLMSSNLPASPVWFNWIHTTVVPFVTVSGSVGTLPGTVTVTYSEAIDGGRVFHSLFPYPHTITNLTPTFRSIYGPGMSRLSLMGNFYNDTGDRYKVDIDFSGLAGGVLPANALFAFVDFDYNEGMRNLRAFTTGGVQITSPWLIAVAGQAGYLDVDNFNGDQSSSMRPAPALTQSLGVYQLVGDPGHMDKAFFVFRTGAPIRRITYHHYVNDPFRDFSETSYIAIGLSAVPEPSTWGMVLLGAIGLAVANRKRFPRNQPTNQLSC